LTPTPPPCYPEHPLLSVPQLAGLLGWNGAASKSGENGNSSRIWSMPAYKQPDRKLKPWCYRFWINKEPHRACGFWTPAPASGNSITLPGRTWTGKIPWRMVWSRPGPQCPATAICQPLAGQFPAPSKPRARCASGPGICRQAGVPEMGFHALRHAFASNLADHHAPLHAIRDLLGHENISTTSIYLKSIGKRG